MDDSLVDALQSYSDFKVSKNLGSYLGMPVLHKHLLGWKAQHLNLVGRIILMKSVLSSIPIYSMGTIFLPASVFTKFFVGEYGWIEKTHLIGWKDVCKPKWDGGLGICSVISLNMAIVRKLSWRFINDETFLLT
ncbi:hypothetical protein V2J09_013186 [Rumex salicifolius]